jgi:hypothetical protein
MYPTVFTLLGLWDFLICSRIDIMDDTAGVQHLLNQPYLLEYAFTPEVWQEIRCCLVQLRPQEDILPVRAQYDSGQAWNIGLNPLTCAEPLWFALPDVIAAVLLRGRLPDILRAVRLVPHGTLNTLQPVQFGGVVPVDPGGKSFFKVAIEERKRLSRRTDLAEEEQKRLDLALKITANAGAYGIFAEFNRHVLPAGITEYVRCCGRNAKMLEVAVSAPEEPGEFGFPPIAASVTAAARLMLALLERLVTDAGGTYAFCDTDSMAVVATAAGGLTLCRGGSERLADGREAVRAISWDKVEEIRARFAALNPYDRNVIPGSILRRDR